MPTQAELALKKPVKTGKKFTHTEPALKICQIFFCKNGPNIIDWIWQQCSFPGQSPCVGGSHLSAGMSLCFKDNNCYFRWFICMSLEDFHPILFLVTLFFVKVIYLSKVFTVQSFRYSLVFMTKVSLFNLKIRIYNLLTLCNLHIFIFVGGLFCKDF